jgi:selenocysteine-specific elongation factor
MRVVGTAGHVDHGKSTLVAALTGINPDRLKEEQEREMTIDLGFAWLTLPGGEEIGIVDVPGHRDFIENMLAGVGGIDAALLVVAADEGIMPQTREHLAILDLLQIQSGLVVMTKIDLVDDPAWLDLVESDIRNVLHGKLFQDAPILRVSARNRTGLQELLRALSHVLEKTPARADLGRPRLPVDRVFSITGFGTVITGTLLDGKFAAGEEIEILPSGLHGRIRSLQTHKKKEQIAIPGSRTAVNISGLNVEQIQRGEVVTHPGQYHSTQRLDLQFKLLPDVLSNLRHHTEVKLFISTSETIGNIRLLGKEVLLPGETGWLQLELNAPVVAMRGDHFILRRPSPGETLGGGIVLDPQPKERHRRFDEVVLQALKTLSQGSSAEILLQAVITLGPSQVKDSFTRSRLEISIARSALDELLAGGLLVKLDDGIWTMDSIVMAASQWLELKQSIVETLSAYHETYPLRQGMPREELKSRLKVNPRLFNLLVRRLAAEKILTEGEKWVALSGHVIRFSPFQQVKVDRLLATFKELPNSPPSRKECVAEVGEDIFNVLRDSGDLVCVSEEVVFLRLDYEVKVAKIHQVLQQKGKITLAEVRDLLNTSRKYAQALLEHLDAIGVTVREQDYRRLKKQEQ